MKLKKTEEVFKSHYVGYVICDADGKPNAEVTARNWIKEFWVFMGAIMFIEAVMLALVIWKIIEAIIKRPDVILIVTFSIMFLCAIALQIFMIYKVKKIDRIHPTNLEKTIENATKFIDYYEYCSMKLRVVDEELSDKRKSD